MRPRCTVMPVGGHVGEPDRVVRLGEDRLGDVLADLVRVDVERGNHRDVADVVAAELDVHQAGDRLVRVGVLVVLEALDEGRGTVAEPHDRDANFTHAVRSFLRSVAEARRCSPTGAVISYSLSLGVDQIVRATRCRSRWPRARAPSARAGSCRCVPRVAQVRLDLGEPFLQAPAGGAPAGGRGSRAAGTGRTRGARGTGHPPSGSPAAAPAGARGTARSPSGVMA